jgi:hypothetical protein
MGVISEKTDGALLDDPVGGDKLNAKEEKTKKR